MTLTAFFDDVIHERALDRILVDGVCITFELSGEGGGLWTVRRVGDDFEVTRNDAVRPDCRLRCTVSDFCDLVEGKLNPRDGFLEGRLDVQGDVGLVIRLQRLMVSQERAAK